MDISIVQVLPDDVVKALCNTLIRSLWQGLLLAALAGLIVIFTRKASAAMRYNLLVASLLLFAGSTVYTFIDQLQKQVQYHSVDINNQTTLITQFTSYNLPVGIQNTPVTHQLIGYFNDYAQIIVLIWLLIVCARSIQLLTGLSGLYHLRRKSVFNVDELWQARVDQLSVKLGIKQMVIIAQSGITHVPMVIGHLKPIILIPIGLLTTLPVAEIDAILVHELAHIRRRDYLVNLLQSLMEIVFFFNPAVLWISALIKTERENCCDDIAIVQTSSKVNYIQALVSCQEYQLSAPAYAMSFSGRKNHLLGRVKRMVSNNNHSLNTVEKSLLAICLLAAGLITTAFSNADKIHRIITTTQTTITNVNNKIKEDIKPLTEPAQQTKPLAAADEENTPLSSDSTIMEQQIREGIQKKAIADSFKRVSKMPSVASVKPISAVTAIAPVAPIAPVAAVAPIEPVKSGYSVKIPHYNYRPYKEQETDSLRRKIISEMLTDGIIVKKDDLSFKLSTNEFIVNGKKQTDNVYQKYRAEYVKANGNDEWAWYYNYDTTTKKAVERVTITTSN